MHSLLLVGPYDWEAERMPRAEFEGRIAAFWERIPASEGNFAVVYGDSRHHAELCYLTNFVPKVRMAMAIVPRQGEPLLLLPGSRNGFSSAERLSCFKNLDLLTDPARAVDQWLADHPGAPRRAVLLGTAAMRAQQYQQLLSAFPPEAQPRDASATLQAQMRLKRPHELVAIRRACEILGAASGVLVEAQRAKAGVTAVVLEAERAAHGMGAQDVRSLFSLDGGASLRPFTTPIERAVDPLQVSIAVLHAGYWAEGLLLCSLGAHPVRDKVAEALHSVIPAAKAGARACDLADMAEAAVKPFGLHPVSGRNIGNGIGLSIEEAPLLNAASEVVLESGNVVTLCIGASDGRQHALLSAMLHVGAGGSELLWSAV